MKKNILICLLAFLVACNVGDDDDDEAGRADAGGDAASGDSDIDIDAEFSAPDDIIGTWAQQMELDGKLKIKLAQGGAPLVSAFTLTMLYVTKFTPDGDAYTGASESCDLYIDAKPGSGLQGEITIPESFFENLGILEKPISVAADGTVTQGKFTELRGFNEEKFQPDDPMPRFGSEGDCGCTADPDEDGNPGMTLHIDGSIIGLINMKADLYGVERDITSINGLFDTGNHISGLVEWTLEMAMLGVVQPNYQYVFSMVDPPEFEQSNKPEKSRVRFARVADDFTCAELLEQVDELFSNSPYTN